MPVQKNGREIFNDSDINNPDIDGGTIDNAVIGGTTPNTGAFTTLKMTTGAAVGVVVSDVSGNLVADATPALGTPSSGTLDNCTSDTAADNDSSTQLATTAYAKSQDAVLAREPDQGVAMTAAASGSSGITVADNDNIDFGTGNFALVWKGSLPDWTPSAEVTIIDKAVGSDRYIVTIDTGGLVRFRMGATINGSASVASSAATSAVDGTPHEIALSITRETASAAGSIIIYLNGVQLGTTIVITATVPANINNTGPLYVAGNSTVRHASTTHHAYLLNFAPTAAEVLDMYRNGIPESWKWGSQTEQTSGTLVIGKKYRINNWITNDDFTNVGGANVDGTEFTATGTTPTTWTNSSTVVPIGATLALLPENIQPTKWIDATTNQLDATYPTAGYSFTRPFPKEISLVDPDVAHGMTTLASTDTFGRLAPISGTIGGLDVIGMTDATQDGALRLTGVIGAADPTDTHAAVHLRGGKVSGTGWTDLAAAETVLRLSNHEADLITVLGNGNVGIGTTGPTSTHHTNGSVAAAIINKTADYTATVSDYTITCDATSAAFTITLPAASGCTGRIYNIKKIDSSANAVTIDGNSTETIDGALTQALNSQYESLTIMSNGTLWYII